MADDSFPAMMAFMPVYLPVVPFQHEAQNQSARAHDAASENASERLSDGSYGTPVVSDNGVKEILFNVCTSDTWTHYDEGLWLRATHLKLFDDCRSLREC